MTRWDEKENRGVGVLQYDQKYRQSGKSPTDRPVSGLASEMASKEKKNMLNALPLFFALFLFFVRPT